MDWGKFIKEHYEQNERKYRPRTPLLTKIATWVIVPPVLWAIYMAYFY